MCLFKITSVRNYAYRKIIFISGSQIIKCQSGKNQNQDFKKKTNPSQKASWRLELPLRPFVDSEVSRIRQ